MNSLLSTTFNQYYAPLHRNHRVLLTVSSISRTSHYFIEAALSEVRPPTTSLATPSSVQISQSTFLRQPPLQRGPYRPDNTLSGFSYSRSRRASGKAGGFLAKDWHGGPTASLAALSFNLHDELSKEYGGDKKWGYRRVKTVQVTVSGQRRSKAVPEVDWVDGATSSQ